MRNGKKTFNEILREVAPQNARNLETKARSASWLAKIHPAHSTALYSVKDAALRQLFGIPAHAPEILEAWTTTRGFLLSVRLRQTSAMLHMPFEGLRPEIQRTQGAWIARRARGRQWQQLPNHRRAMPGSKAA